MNQVSDSQSITHKEGREFDTFRTSKIFQGQNNMYLCKVGTHSSILIEQGVLMSEVSFKRGSIVHVAAEGKN